LKKKLSGERITDQDPVDDIMDKYLRPDYDRIPMGLINEKSIGKGLDRKKFLILLILRVMRILARFTPYDVDGRKVVINLIGRCALTMMFRYCIASTRCPVGWWIW
jgi:hypothetical protein